jgi:cell division septal protein FtsQ
VKHLKSVFIFSAALLFGTAAILAGLQQSGLFIVQTIPVDVLGDQPVANAQVNLQPGPLGLRTRMQATLHPFAQKKIWDIPLSQIKAAIMKDEWVKDVLISRMLPNRIQVKIVPKSTAVILVGSKGELWPLTEEGVKLATLPASALPDRPLLRGDIFAKDIAKRKEAILFALNLPAQGAINQKNVSEIFWNKEDGYSLMLMQPKVEVKLGSDSLDTKVLRAGQVVNYMSAHRLSGRLIDASFSKKVLVRLRKGP